MAGICAVEPEEGWEPGRRAGYHLACGMTMLAEVVRRVDGRRFEQYVRDEVFEPLGMDDCWVGMPADRHAGYGDRIGTMHATADPEAGAVPLGRARLRRRPGPVRPRRRRARTDAPVRGSCIGRYCAAVSSTASAS